MPPVPGFSTNELLLLISGACYAGLSLRSGFHRWSVRASKLGLPDKKVSWKAILGVARPRSQDLGKRGRGTV